MQLVLLTFVIALLNLCLGYAIGVYLGYGPPTLSDAREALLAPRPAADISSDQVVAIEEVIQGLEQELPALADTSLSAEPEVLEDPVAEPELSDLDALRRSVDKAMASLTEFTDRLEKSGRGQSDRTAWSFVGELREVCEPYLQHLSEAAEGPCDEIHDSDQATAVSDEVEDIILEQVAQLETTLSNLQYMNFDSGFPSAMSRLRSDAGNTLSTARKLQKVLNPEPETTDEQHAQSVSE